MKIKKRNKLFTVCLALVLAAGATIGGVLAVQVMADSVEKDQLIAQTTQGEESDVKAITQQRQYDNGTLVGLKPYEDNAVLYPLVGSAQYNGKNFDKYGMPTAEGYVDQIVTLRNDSNESKFVRLLVAIPAALEDVGGDSNKNALHWNVGNRFMADGSFGVNGVVKNQAYDKYKLEQLDGTQKVNGVGCNVYVFTYMEPLAANAETDAAAFVGFYLDKKVNVKKNKVYLNGDYTGYEGATVDIAIKAQSVSVEGWTDLNHNDTTIDEAFQTLSTNPWDGEATSKN